MAAAFFSIALASSSSRTRFLSFASSSSRGLPFPGKAFVPSALASVSAVALFPLPPLKNEKPAHPLEEGTGGAVKKQAGVISCD
jgi:hypothetical protein